MQSSDVGSVAARSEAVRKYFTKTPSPPIYATANTLAVFAALCALPATIALIYAFRAEEGWRTCFGCAAFAGILAALAFAVPSSISRSRTKQTYAREYHLAEPKPPDTQIDAWYRDDLEHLRKRALDKLDLVAEQVSQDNNGEPLVVAGPGPSPQVRRGQDGRVRFSCHEILIIYLTPYHLAAFKCVIDLHDGGIRTETTQEYHYNDVVSVSTQTDHSAFAWYWEGQLKQEPTHQRFAISVASGEQISVAVGVAESPEYNQDNSFVKDATEAIRSIRTRLRAKKGGSVDPTDREV